MVAIRLPGHGTVPAGLTEVEWEDWLAATRLAVREAAARAPGKPLEIVGFSNGGALALKYALDALDDAKLARPSRLVLISPMIGITSFARFAGLAAMPAYLPAFAKAAWLGVIPEFNPFKYNSFPVNGAVQSHRLTRALQATIASHAAAGKLGDLPPSADLPVGDGLHRLDAGDHHRLLRAAAGQRQRAGAVRHQPQHQARAALARDLTIRR